jgi:hypothetical protein
MLKEGTLARRSGSTAARRAALHTPQPSFTGPAQTGFLGQLGSVRVNGEALFLQMEGIF